MPGINQSPGGCGCGACTATISGNTKGCNTLNVAGITVEARDSTSGGTLLGSATTDSSGNFSIAVTGATAGNAIVVVWTHSRFSTATTTLAHTAGTPGSTTWKCSGTSSGVNKSLTPATGYHCLSGSGCAYPFADTLYASHNYLGSFTLTWVSTDKWSGSGSYAYPGCSDPVECIAAPCAGGSVGLDVVLWYVLGALQGYYDMDVDATTLCPIGAAKAREVYTLTSVDCTAMEIVLTASGGTVKRCLYCDNPSPAPMFTITE